MPGAFASLLRTTTEDPATFRYPLLFAGASLGIGVLALDLTRASALGSKVAEEDQSAPNAQVAVPYRTMAFLGVVVLVGGMGRVQRDKRDRTGICPGKGPLG